eukprot:1557973-Rhodomonas_salina.2
MIQLGLRSTVLARLFCLLNDFDMILQWSLGHEVRLAGALRNSQTGSLASHSHWHEVHGH